MTFAETFQAEMDAAAKDTLVQAWMWANGQFDTHDTHDDGLRDRAERWADGVIGKGPEHTMVMLRALAPDRCPTCDRPF